MAFLRNLCVTGGGVLASRTLGFVRDAAVAWLLGGGAVADAFSLALRLPYLPRRLFGEGTLSLTLTASCAAQGPGGACCLARAVLWRAALVVALAVAAGVVFAPDLVRLLSPGLAESTRAAAVQFTRLCLPYALFAVIAAGCMAGLHARGRFLLPGLAPSLFNVLMLACAAIAALTRATPHLAALYLGAGVLLGGVAQIAVQYPGLHKLCRAESAPPASSATRAALCALPGGLLAAAVPQLAFLLACVPASFLGAGHLSALFYAERLLEFPIGLTAALGMLSVPVLAAAFKISPARLGRVTAAAVSLTLCLILPAMAGLAAVAAPLVKTLFAHGAFDARAAELTTLTLYAYLPSLPAYAVARPLLAAGHAVGHGRAISACSLLALAAALGCGWLLTVPLGLSIGPALGADAGLWVQTALLWNLLGRQVRLRAAWTTIALAAAASLAVYGVAAVLTVMAPTPLLALALAIPAGMLTFVVLIWPARGPLRLMLKELD